MKTLNKGEAFSLAHLRGIQAIGAMREKEIYCVGVTQEIEGELFLTQWTEEDGYHTKRIAG